MRLHQISSDSAPPAPAPEVATVGDSSCGICLEQLRHPISLPACGHTFCFACLRAYKELDINASCPYCRSLMPDIDVGFLDRAVMHGARAKKLTGEQRLLQCELALAEVEKVLSADPSDLRANYLRADICLIAGDANVAIEAFKSILDHNARTRQAKDEVMRIIALADAADEAGDEAEADRLMTQAEQMQSFKTFNDGSTELLATKLKLAAAHQAAGEWDAANVLYMAIVGGMGDNPKYGGPHLQLRLWMGMTRTFYEMAAYERAIKGSGGMAVAMNRHYPGVHKYVALSEKALGDLGAAVKTMSRAVLYEAPWDLENLAENRALLHELAEELTTAEHVSVNVT
jgi:tetratricopeptide (TPR) repeat protein